MALGFGISRRIALIFRPLRSKRATMSPTRPRCTASGLIMTKVVSRAMRAATKRQYLRPRGGSLERGVAGGDALLLERAEGEVERLLDGGALVHVLVGRRGGPELGEAVAVEGDADGRRHGVVRGQLGAAAAQERLR